MSAVCQVTGRTPGFGKSVSHSRVRTARRSAPHVARTRSWLASEDRWITLRVSAKGICTSDAQGVEAVVRRLRREGQRV